MPQMGESIAEGTLSRWLKKVGDSVKRDEPMFEISTDKVDAEIPAPSAGVLVEILVQEGQTVPVQTVVARLETDAAAAAEVKGQRSEVKAGGAAPLPPSPVPAGDGTPAALTTTAPQPAIKGAEPPKRAALTSDLRPQTSEARPQTSVADSLEERLRTKSSPLVRKIAAEHGIELSGLAGSGLAGRVTKKDIIAVIESGVKPAASMYAPAGIDAHGPPIEPWPGDRVEPMTKIRRLTAEHMTLARRTAAHVTTFHEIDLTRIAKIRQQRKAEFEAQTGEKLTYLPFILQAALQALAKYPVINAVASGDRIIYRKAYNIGIAVALDWGLIVPVIKNADNLSLAGLTRTLNDLAGRARSKKLRPEEVEGATFTVTNYGVFGSIAGTPIIPVGTSAILGIGAIEKRAKVLPGVDGEDTIAIRTCAYFALSFDHRIVDGADADRFMAFLKTSLETATEPAA